MPWTRALLAFFCAALQISSPAQTVISEPYPVPFKVLRAAFDPVQQRAFIVPAGTNRIEVVDLENHSMIAGVSFAHSPESIAITPNGQRLFVALVDRTGASTNGWVSDIDLSNLTITKTVPIPLIPADIVATDFGIFMVSSAEPEFTAVATFSASTGVQIDAVTAMPGGLQLALHPSQNRVYGVDPVNMFTWVNTFPITRDGEMGVPWTSLKTGHHLGKDVFIVPTGTEILTRGGTFLTSNANESEDVKYTRSVAADVRSLSGDTNFNITAYITNGDDLQMTDFGMTQGLWHRFIPGGEYVKIYNGKIIVLAVAEQESKFHFLQWLAPNAELNRPPAVTLTTNDYREVFPVGSTLTLQARAQDLDGAVQTLKVFHGINELVSLNNVASIDVVGTIQAGLNDFYAVAYDNFNAGSTSTVIRIVGNYPPEVEITQPATTFTSFNLPEEIVIRAQATDPDGSVTEVRLVVNGTSVARDTETPFDFTFTPPDYGFYFVEVQAIDNAGLQSSAARNLRYYRPNDDFGIDMPVIPGTNATIVASTVAATRQKFEPLHAGEPGGRSLWWRWAVPQSQNSSSGTVIIDTHGSDFDTLLAVYTLPLQTFPALTNLVPVASNDDDPNEAPASRVKFTANSGQIFYIAVDGRDGVAGTAKLNLKFEPSPASTVSNDNVLRATRILENTQLPGSNVGATKEIGEPNHAGNVGGASVWWRFDAQAGGTIMVSTRGSTFDTVMAIYTNATTQTSGPPPNVANLRLVASNDDGPDTTTSLVTFSPKLPFASYWVAVDGYNGAQGDINIRLSRLQLPAVSPINDLFTNATALTGSAVITNGSTLRAGAEPGEPAHIDGRWTGSVWYMWTAPTNGPVLVSTKGSDFDTILAVYTGADINSLTPIASNDDDPTGLQTSAAIFDATAETQYHIAVAGYSGTGNLVLSINQAPGLAPRLLSQWAEGRLVLRAAAVNATVTIESSTDLINWKSVRTLPGGEGEFAIVPSELQGQQFYRLRFGN